jgi:hypothetical protein
MRYMSVVTTGILLGAAAFSSCTCHEQVAQKAAFQEPRSGFHASQPSPQARAAAPTATAAKAAPQEVAEAAGTPTAAVQIPEDFPKDVPIFTDAVVAQVQDLPNKAHNVIFNTAAPIPDVSSFYQEHLTRAGWRVTQQFSRSNHAFLSFQKGALIANVTIAEDVHHPGQQVIAIMYEEQQPLEFDEF